MNSEVTIYKQFESTVRLFVTISLIFMVSMQIALVNETANIKRADMILTDNIDLLHVEEFRKLVKQMQGE